jgi:hypothetical protein
VPKLPDPESKGLGSHAWACPDYCEMTRPGVPVPFKIWAKDLPASAGQYTILNQCNPLSLFLLPSHGDDNKISSQTSMQLTARFNHSNLRFQEWFAQMN